MMQCFIGGAALMGSTTCLERTLPVSPNPRQFYYAEHVTAFICLTISTVILQYYKLNLNEMKSSDDKLRSFL